MESSPNESKEKIKPWEKRREKNPNKEMNSEDLPAITNDFLFHHLLPSLPSTLGSPMMSREKEVIER